LNSSVFFQGIGTNKQRSNEASKMDLVVNDESYNDDQERWKSNWPLGPYDCLFFQYKNKCMYVPYFFPMAVCGTCFLLGRIRSKLVQEAVCCLGMGEQGCSLCLLSTCPAVFGPLGGWFWFSWIATYLRHQVVNAYNIDDIYVNDNTCCCCSLITICYPCSLFQIYMTLLTFEERANDDFESPLVSSFQ